MVVFKEIWFKFKIKKFKDSSTFVYHLFCDNVTNKSMYRIKVTWDLVRRVTVFYNLLVNGTSFK